jgi:tRNA (adenine37-N6)-methyltransferase
VSALTLNPIGYIRSEHQILENTPIQPVFARGCTGRVELLPEYVDGLKSIEGFSHIYLLYWLHKAKPAEMIVKPFLQDCEHGIFATRFPHRPNPIGMSIVRFVKKEGAIVYVNDVDILDGTPLLDIKPYSTAFDCFPGSRNGWYSNVDPEDAQKLGKRGYDNFDKKDTEI